VPRGVTVRRLSDRDDLAALHALVVGVFAALDVTPPSSMTRKTLDDMRRRATTQDIFLAEAAGALIGSVFCERQNDLQYGDVLYVGRLAVIDGWRRRGVASMLIDAVVAHARDLKIGTVTLRSRTSLPGNVALFERHGFKSIGIRSHPGFTEPTFHEMVRVLEPAGDVCQGVCRNGTSHE
jgi:phosphinothricin acetyltransferase